MERKNHNIESYASENTSCPTPAKGVYAGCFPGTKIPWGNVFIASALAGVGQGMYKGYKTNNQKNHLSKETMKKIAPFLGAGTSIGAGLALQRYQNRKKKQKQNVSADEKQALEIVAFEKEKADTEEIEQFYKQASRAWKAHFGDLTEDSIKRLKRAKILNHKKELDGLNKGTLNIINSVGGKIDTSRNGKKALPRMSQIANDVLRDHPENNQVGLKKQLRDIYKTIHSTNRGFFTICNGTEEGNGMVSIPKKLYKISKKEAGQIRKINGSDDPCFFIPNIIGKTSSKDADYIRGIFARHEADELRTSKRIYSNKKLHKIDPDDGSKVSRVGISSHQSPEVLLRESAHVAIAPKNVKKKMGLMRSFGKEQNQLENMAEKSKLSTSGKGRWSEYSKDAVYVPSHGRKMEQYILNSRK